MGMDFIEVLERIGQLGQHGGRIPQIHSAHVVTLEGVDEALRHTVALWTAHRRRTGFNPSDLAMLRVSFAM